MSLLTTTPLYAGHDQFDMASLVTDAGVHYQCFVWLNRAQYRVEAYCERTQVSGGEPVLVFHNYVATSSDASTTAGYPLDCPKIIAVGSTFVVHWLQAAGTDEAFRTWALFRATMDMTAFTSALSGWTARGSAGVDAAWALYDACPVIGSTTDFVVARSTGSLATGSEITVQRFDGFSWLDNDWDEFIARDHAQRVLGVYAHDADNDVIITYQRTDGANNLELWSGHLDADTGDNFTDVKTFNDEADANFLQVGHERVAANQVVVAAEWLPEATRLLAEGQPSHQHIHTVGYRRINSTTAARIGIEHWVRNAYMVSKPWAYSNGASITGATVDVYMCIAFRSIYLTNEWEQAAIFAVNLNLASWESASAGSSIRPRLIANYVGTGIPDARTSGWHPENGDLLAVSYGAQKRVNHCSRVALPPPYGPDVKTRSVAVGTFAKLGTVAMVATDPYLPSGVAETEFIPENLGCSEFRVTMENPQGIFHDDFDPTQPVDNFKGAYPRTMFQTANCGRALFISGGTPYLYDGKQAVEVGFPYRPELYYAVADTDGSMADGVYQYYAVYSWRDAQGQVHRSGPSRILQITLAGADDAVDLRCRSMTLSMKGNTAFCPTSEEIQIELFRTEAGGATFYRVFGQMTGTSMRVRDTPLNNATAQFVQLSDTLVDSELILQGLGPYQYGADPAEGLVGPLPQTSPALTCCTQWMNRIIGSSALDPAIYWYTDEIFADVGSDFAQAPFFTGDQTFRIGDIGETVAFQVMNNALFAFTSNDIYGLTGTDAGAGLLQIQAERLHAGTGCIEPRSVALGPDGIFFQAAKGYYLLARNRELEYIGADVEDEIREAGNVRSAVILEDRNQLRVTCNGRPITTYTTTWTVAPGEDPTGEWEIELTGFDGVSVIAHLDADQEMDSEIIANALAADIFVLIENGTLDDIIVSATPDGPDIVVVWAPDVVPSYTDSAPGGSGISAVDTSDLATLPRVLIYDTLRKMWSRAELVQTHANARMSETVDGCSWRLTSGETSHCVLTQGALLVERATTDPDRWMDQTHADDVGIPIDVKTGWLHFAGVAGYQRIKSIGVQGRKPDSSDYSIDLEYVRDGDYDNPEEELGLEVTTVSPAYSRVRPSIQKCSAIRVRVYEDFSQGENLSLVNLIFELGIKPGPRRVATGQVAT